MFKNQIHNPVLTVDKYYPEVKGKYVCVAENEYGTTSIDSEYYYIVRAPGNCNEYTQYRSVFLSPEYSASIGGNVTLTCTLQFACIELESCAEEFIYWRDSLFPTNRMLKGEGYNCLTCSGKKYINPFAYFEIVGTLNTCQFKRLHIEYIIC